MNDTQNIPDQPHTPAPTPVQSAPGEARGKSTKLELIRLSTWLQSVPEAERARAIKELPNAIRKGTIKAIPVNDPAFEISYLYPSGRRYTRTLNELAVCLDQNAKNWLQEQRRESRYDRMGVTGKPITSFDSLLQSEEDIPRLARIHHRHLNRKITDKTTNKNADKTAGKTTDKTASKAVKAQ
ncbi:hypothetical protein DAETH_37320 (plasmid) [Deinococcus aetherius]|uniref:Uncharacterized protein n=1 Tax=Deinococcus aetherius TaxID=200252 RepID=A0ABN6RPJ3_9DEIO|nr:hypothetical protein [Deinococcus aetherius]BDP43763.1 hypothetical protein DAETH_37320 [Deinococcus aetherius]